MRVVKSLNNNMVLVKDSDGNEYICQGRGIGWQKRRGDSIDPGLVERRFRPEDETESTHFQQLFSEISDEFWQIAEEVVKYGLERYALRMSQKVLIPLCDHMAGSVERYKKGVTLTNPMLWDIKRIYPKEYKVGLYAISLLEEHFGVAMLEDEAAFLAYHFINAQLRNDNITSVSPDTMARLAGSVLDIVQQSFQITLDVDDWNYQRFLTHLKFFVNRCANRQNYEDTEDDELYESLKRKYPHVYNCVGKIADFVLIDLRYDVSQEERLYLMIHIERVTRRYRGR